MVGPTVDVVAAEGGSDNGPSRPPPSPEKKKNKKNMLKTLKKKLMILAGLKRKKGTRHLDVAEDKAAVGGAGGLIEGGKEAGSAGEKETKPPEAAPDASGGDPGRSSRKKSEVKIVGNASEEIGTDSLVALVEVSEADRSEAEMETGEELKRDEETEQDEKDIAAGEKEEEKDEDERKEQGAGWYDEVKALMTEQGPAWYDEVKALMTEQGPAWYDEVKALMTGQGPAWYREVEALMIQQPEEEAETPEEEGGENAENDSEAKEAAPQAPEEAPKKKKVGEVNRSHVQTVKEATAWLSGIDAKNRELNQQSVIPGPNRTVKAKARALDGMGTVPASTDIGGSASRSAGRRGTGMTRSFSKILGGRYKFYKQSKKPSRGSIDESLSSTHREGDMEVLEM